MKRHAFVWRGAPVRSGLALTTLILSTGCTHFAAKRAQARAQLDEHSRALTTAVVDSLTLQPAEDRDSYTEFALRVAREDQRIEGLPLDPIAVEPFVQPSATNALPKLQAERALGQRFTEIEKLLASERQQTEHLLEFGAAHEAERNRARVRWTKWIGGSSLLIGGLVAFCVFVPAALPILGRLLAWIVSKIPSAAGAFGVVSVQAFDAVVKGIERTKSNPPSNNAGLSNAAVPTVPAADSWTSLLHLNLSREMDAAHKALVRARKAALPQIGGAQ